MATRRSARLSGLGAAGDTTHTKQSMPPPSVKSHKRKASTANPSPVDLAPPTTPQKRRARKVDPAPPPATPTPSNAKLIGESVPAFVGRGGGSSELKPKPAAVARLANPNATNATLLSPETSRIIAAPAAGADPSSPSKAPTSRKTTTATLLDDGNQHLIRVDPRMKPLVEQNHCHVFSPEGLAEQIDPFESLCSGIISQQISGSAAKSIKARFIALFEDGEGDDTSQDETAAPSPGGTVTGGYGKRFPHPSQVAATSLEKLRTAGLSQRKAEYLVGLAEKFAAGELSASMLADAPYEEVVEKLTAVRGLGRWSVEMFACFALKRMDVFSLGDLGVQRGMAAFVGRDVAKLKNKGGKWKYMSEQEMTEISDRFKPFRSLFMWYMWRVEETDISTFE